jgi:glycosyltransferase involved in cell wall biosynthesis
MRVLMWEHFAPGGPIRVAGHHLAERFVRRGDHVAWCAGPVSPLNLVRASDESRARLGLWRRGGEWSDDRTLFAYAPMTLLPHRRRPLVDRRAVGAATLRATVPSFRRVLSAAGFAEPDVVFMEPGAPLLGLLDLYPRARAVYRMCDDTAAFPDTPRSFAAIEAEVCRRVDLVVATARRLGRRAKDLGARAVLHLPNACDPVPFATAAGPEPWDLSGLPRPRAIYAGAIESWFDAALVAETARRLPVWSFVLIGPVRGRHPEIASLANVRILGARPYETLPGYFAASDAAIVPFRLTPMTHAIHPIKVYEYLAAGLPVVSTPMEETAAMGAPVTLAADAPGFAAALESAHATDDAGARASRVAFAARNTWDDRFAALLEAMGLVAGAARVPFEARAAAGGRR